MFNNLIKKNIFQGDFSKLINAINVSVDSSLVKQIIFSTNGTSNPTIEIYSTNSNYVFQDNFNIYTSLSDIFLEFDSESPEMLPFIVIEISIPSHLKINSINLNVSTAAIQLDSSLNINSITINSDSSDILIHSNFNNLKIDTDFSDIEVFCSRKSIANSHIFNRSGNIKYFYR